MLSMTVSVMWSMSMPCGPGAAAGAVDAETVAAGVGSGATSSSSARVTARGAVETASQLSHQEFVLALETTLASGTVTLLLASTARLTDRLLKARISRGE